MSETVHISAGQSNLEDPEWTGTDWARNLVGALETPNVKASAKAEIEELPAGITVAGNPGFVQSPWTMEKGPIDVSGIPSGTKVKCPYTGKIFRVP